MNPESYRHRQWYKAAFLGSVWASLEIVVGSFLHNLNVPFTGTILAGAGVSLLVAGHSLWREKGIVWRAGIICAVMKSVSPSGVILGPMIGIGAEALAVEASLRIIGGNAAGYIIGGTLACMMPFLQKLVSYVIVYGMDIVTLFDSLIKYASNILNIEPPSVPEILLAAIFVNSVFGAAAAYAGMIIGRRIQLSTKKNPLGEIALPHSDKQFSQDGRQHFSFSFLIIHIGVLVSGMIIQAAYFLLYIPVCAFRYGRLRAQFRRPGLWIEIGVISVAAGIIIGGVTLSSWNKGMIIGGSMFGRALFVVSLFTAISSELRNPAIVRAVFRTRLKLFLSALDVAFSALPSMIDSLQKEKLFLKHPVDSLSIILARAIDLAQLHRYPEKIFILSGEESSGKTSLLLLLSEKLRDENVSVGGILQLSVRNEKSLHGFDLHDILSHATIPLCRTDAPDSGISAGPFNFYPDALKSGRESLAPQKIGDCDVVVIDELGPLEISGGGWANPLFLLLHNYSGVLILVVRNSLVGKVCEHFAIAPCAIWTVAKDTVESILSDLKIR